MLPIVLVHSDTNLSDCYCGRSRLQNLVRVACGIDAVTNPTIPPTNMPNMNHSILYSSHRYALSLSFFYYKVFADSCKCVKISNNIYLRFSFHSFFFLRTFLLSLENKKGEFRHYQQNSPSNFYAYEKSRFRSFSFKSAFYLDYFRLKIITTAFESHFNEKISLCHLWFFRYFFCT